MIKIEGDAIETELKPKDKWELLAETLQAQKERDLEDLNHEFHQRTRAQEAFAVMASIAEARRLLRKAEAGTQAYLVVERVSGRGDKIKLEIGDDAALAALRHEETHQAGELKHAGVSYGEWA